MGRRLLTGNNARIALPRIAVDLSALRASRDLRLLVLGNWVTGLGTQAALVALPFQLYEQTRSAFLTGLLGAVELVPLIAFALYGGALADRFDRRRLLLLDQIALIACAAALALLVWAHGDPPLAGLYILGGLLAGFGAVQNVARSAIVPNLVDPVHLRSALALNFGLFQLTLVVGPALGGILIGVLGTGAVFAIDAVSCLAMVGALVAMAPQPPHPSDDRPPVLHSIAEGLRFVRSNQALMGSFAIDLVAMAFGMPRALFPVLAVSVYHAGPEGTGLLFAAVSAGATVAALTTAWLEHARRLGLIVFWAVVVWGGAIAAAGLMSSFVLAALLLAIAGAADSVSAVCRSTINQTVTPDALRGRMSSVFSLVVTSGPRVGDVEAGAVAGLAGVRFSVSSGGLACIVGAVAVAAAFPALIRYDAEREIAAMPTAQP
jgi:MFS family permease